MSGGSQLSAKPSGSNCAMAAGVSLNTITSACTLLA
jgi:hypothetical protein